MQVVVLLLICLGIVGNLMANPTQTARPRMIFTDTDRDTFKRLSLHGNDAHIQLLLGQQDVVTAAGKTHLYFANFHNLQLSSKTPAFGSECSGSDPVSNCQYNITVIHKRKDDQLFMCGNNGRETTCCNMNMSEPSALCTPAEQFASIKQVHIKEGEPSVLIESSSGEELYVTHSGTEESVGIHKSGMNRVRPDNHRKEQKYVSLVVSNRTIDQQNKIFAFYNEKKTDPSMNSDMWLPFVSQVCMADRGGSKLYRQFEWTSQLQARLYCGDKSSRKHYSELVDVAALHADQWQDTRVYALFKNEWGTSAVCEYTVGDIERVFTKSEFKGYTEAIPDPRPGTCTGERAAMPAMRVVENHSEMEDTIQPRRAFISTHHYTHLCVDSLHNQTVLLLSLENGGVQKVLENDTQTFIIAEYHPFSHRAHVDNMILNPSTKKLYVSSRREIVQINLESCAKYGASCQECALASDPYCAWDGTHCSPATSDTHNMEKGNQHACSQSNAMLSREAGVKESVDPIMVPPGSKHDVDPIMVPPGSKHFLQCPISSLHAEYSWHHDSKTTPCNPEDHCLLLIHSMSSKDEGLYWCEWMEKGYIKTLAQYRLQLEPVLYDNWPCGPCSGATGPPMSVTLTSFCLIVAAVMLR